MRTFIHSYHLFIHLFILFKFCIYDPALTRHYCYRPLCRLYRKINIPSLPGTIFFNLSWFLYSSFLHAFFRSPSILNFLSCDQLLLLLVLPFRFFNLCLFTPQLLFLLYPSILHLFSLLSNIFFNSLSSVSLSISFFSSFTYSVL